MKKSSKAGPPPFESKYARKLRKRREKSEGQAALERKSPPARVENAPALVSYDSQKAEKVVKAVVKTYVKGYFFLEADDGTKLFMSSKQVKNSSFNSMIRKRVRIKCVVIPSTPGKLPEVKDILEIISSEAVTS